MKIESSSGDLSMTQPIPHYVDVYPATKHFSSEGVSDGVQRLTVLFPDPCPFERPAYLFAEARSGVTLTGAISEDPVGGFGVSAARMPGAQPIQTRLGQVNYALFSILRGPVLFIRDPKLPGL